MPLSPAVGGIGGKLDYRASVAQWKADLLVGIDQLARVGPLS